MFFSRQSHTLCIVITTFNRKKELFSLLKDLETQIDDHTNVLTVNDGSSDDTLKMLEEEFPKVDVINGSGDWWYTKSINEGFKFAIKNLNPDFLLTFNDDIKLSDNYIKELIKATKTCDEKTIIGSLGITNETIPRIVTSGNKWKNRYLGIYENHIKFLKQVQPDKLSGLHNSVTLPGRGMLIPTKALKELNYFDEKFKQYHSDSDFTLRALKKGYKVKISWDAKIYVALNKTSDTTSFLNSSFRQVIKSYFDPVSRNYLPSKSRFIWRHNPKISYPIIMTLFLVLTFWKAIKLKLNL